MKMSVRREMLKSIQGSGFPLMGWNAGVHTVVEMTRHNDVRAWSLQGRRLVQMRREHVCLCERTDRVALVIAFDCHSSLSMLCQSSTWFLNHGFTL